MSNAPTAEDFPLRVVAFIGGVMALTPLVRWIASYLREARMRELRDWFRTADGKAYMSQQFQETMELEKRYMRDYLDEYFEQRKDQK